MRAFTPVSRPSSPISPFTASIIKFNVDFVSPTRPMSHTVSLFIVSSLITLWIRNFSGSNLWAYGELVSDAPIAKIRSDSSSHNLAGPVTVAPPAPTDKGCLSSKADFPGIVV